MEPSEFDKKFLSETGTNHTDNTSDYFRTEKDEYKEALQIITKSSYAKNYDIFILDEYGDGINYRWFSNRYRLFSKTTHHVDGIFFKLDRQSLPAAVFETKLSTRVHLQRLEDDTIYDLWNCKEDHLYIECSENYLLFGSRLIKNK